MNTTTNTATLPAAAHPVAVLRRTTTIAAVALIASLLYLVPTAHDAGATTVEPASRNERIESFELLNRHRAHHRVGAIRYSVTLSRKAQAWAEHMAATGRFEHSVLTEGVPAGWRGLGENIAYDTNVRRVQNAWAHSPGHNANMLNPAFDNVGVGLARVGNRLYAVHVFGDYQA